MESLGHGDPQVPPVLLAGLVIQEHLALKAVLVREALQAKVVPLVSQETLVQWDSQDQLDLRVQLEHLEPEAVLELMVNKDKEVNVVFQELRVQLVRLVILELMVQLVLQGQEEVPV